MGMRQREKILLEHFLRKFYPFCLRWKNVRLGKLPDAPFPKMYRVIQRYADAIVYDGRDVIIIEAKMKADAGAISQLELYEKLFYETPEFNYLRSCKVRKVFLCAVDDPNLRSLCEDKGIAFVHYDPTQHPLPAK